VGFSPERWLPICGWTGGQGPSGSGWTPPSSSRRQRAVERFTGRLNLTPEQATQLNQILDEVRDTYQEQESVIERLRQEAPASIREILDDEQETEFDEMLSRGDRRRRRRERDRDD